MSYPVNLPERRVVPLSEVMSEQLASKLESENHPSQYEEQDPDLLLALYLSTLDQEQSTNASTSTPTTTQTPTSTPTASISSSPAPSTQLQDDYLIACLLQADLDSQSQKAPVQKPKTQLREYNDEDDEEEYEYMKLRGTGRGPLRTMKTSKGEIVTKHDPKRAGALNSARLEANLTRLPTGDLTGTSSSGGADEEETSEKLGLILPTRVFNSLHQKTKKMTRLGIRYKNIREDRQVQEEVLDVRTRRILQKLVNSRSLSRIEGTLSTGKESRVFLAYSEFQPHDIAEPDQAPEPESGEEIAYAVKVFKEAVGGYADRERYLPTRAIAQRRVLARRGGKGGGKRREILVWAEKEFRNLKELHRAGLRVPQPALLRQQVVLMKFLGDSDNGLQAPRLKDAIEQLSEEQITQCYWELVRMMRRMYQTAKLVHADLSEYNVLWYQEKPWFIDVSQSVPAFHENALTFLRRDCLNISIFFDKKGVIAGALSPRQLFEFVTDESLGQYEYDENDTSVTHNFVLKKISEENLSNPLDWSNDQVFLNSFIPRTLADVSDPLVEIESLKKNQTETDLFHTSVTGLKKDLTLRTNNEDDLPCQEEESCVDYYDEEDEVDDDDEDEDNE